MPERRSRKRPQKFCLILVCRNHTEDGGQRLSAPPSSLLRPPYPSLRPAPEKLPTGATRYQPSVRQEPSDPAAARISERWPKTIQLRIWAVDAWAIKLLFNILIYSYIHRSRKSNI